MAEIIGIETSNSSLKNLESPTKNEFELQETAPILPKSALHDIEVPKTDENRIEIAANEISGLNEPNSSPENPSEAESSILNGKFFTFANLTYFAAVFIFLKLKL